MQLVKYPKHASFKNIVESKGFSTIKQVDEFKKKRKKANANHIQKFVNALHQDRVISIKIAIVCNHIYEDFRTILHNEMRNTIFPSQLQA